MNFYQSRLYHLTGAIFGVDIVSCNWLTHFLSMSSHFDVFTWVAHHV